MVFQSIELNCTKEPLVTSETEIKRSNSKYYVIYAISKNVYTICT